MSKKKGEDALCIECKEKVTSKQYSVACCVCERWVHKDCGIDDDEYKLIDKIFKKKGSHFWSCDGCSLGLSKLQIIAHKNREEINTLKDKYEELNTAKEQQSADIQDAKEEISILKKDVSDLKSKDPVGNDNESVYKELDLRESKKMNLMFYKVPEQDSNLTAKEKKSIDETKIQEIIAEVGLTIDVEKDLKFVARVGVFSEDKVRPVTIGFRNVDTRDKVLTSAWMLGKSKTYHEISISPDLTKIQLSKEKELQQEAKDNNDALSGEDAKNYIWKLIGVRGQRQLKRVKKKEDPRPRTQSVRRTRQEMEGESDTEIGTRRKKQC